VAILSVFIGAGAGGVSRFLLGSWIQAVTGGGFPWGTLLINVTGSFALTFTHYFLGGTAASADWRMLLGVGFCGGYTTFSAFSYESLQLMESGAWGRAGAYVLASVILSIAGALAGVGAAQTLLART
jgi:CrcB protein